MKNNFVDFEPEKPKRNDEEIPYLEDLSRLSGWEGHTTQKDERVLLSEIMNEIGYLGGQVMDWSKGTFTDRYGKRTGYVFRIMVITPEGNRIPAKVEVVALPVRRKTDANLSQALRTAMWNLRLALAASRRMEKLIPGYRAIVGFLQQTESGPTLSQSWLMSDQKSLPEPDVIDGEVE